MTELSDYVTFHNPRLASRFANRKIPVSTLFEAYFDGDLDFRCELQELLASKDFLVKYAFTAEHVKFFLTRMVPEVAIHSRKQDQRIARDHYDRGNDFFEAYLGDRMVYTCGFFQNGDENLEQAQDNKMELVCQKLQLAEGERFLDIGCGWGTLARYASEHFGTDSTGISIAKLQISYGNERLRAAGLDDKARLLCLDYRDIPDGPYDKIACLEMAEHVGIKNFSKFLDQVYGLLADDGLFFLQIAGLRRATQLEDLVWGLFMNKYIFPGADASMPLGWVTSKLEKAGFEVHSVENIGIHYSRTIQHWYDNWLANRDLVVERYGERLYRIWHVFLGWSVQIAAQGSSTCFQIVAHKNLNHFDRTRFIGQHQLGERLDLAAARDNGRQPDVRVEQAAAE